MLGAGKAELLEGIAETGSIAAAGRRMGMSYKRAWYLIDTLDGYFWQPAGRLEQRRARRRRRRAYRDGPQRCSGSTAAVQANAAAAVDAELKQLAALAAGEPPPAA